MCDGSAGACVEGARSWRSRAEPGGSARRPRGRWSPRARRSRSATSTPSSPSRPRAELGGERLALELDVTDRYSFEGFLDQVEERARPHRRARSTTPGSCRSAVPRGDDDDREAHGRHQRPRRHLRHEVRAAADERRGTGHVVNIASQAGKAGFPGGATYCGTKHFVVGVSEAARAELRDTGIEISCVMPAVVNTELGSRPAGDPRRQGARAEDVADAIVEALERPKFDVWVPQRDARRSTCSCSCCRAAAARRSAGC